MYHKLTVYVKGRYQTNLFPSCCFGHKYHKYPYDFINTCLISFIFYTLCTIACVRDARHRFNIYSILYPLEGVTFSVKITCKFFMFLSVWEKIMSCVYIYAYMEQKGVCCNMKTRVVFI